MIRALKAFVEWLDRRFPEKAVVTPKMLSQFKSDMDSAIHAAEALYDAHSELWKRVESLEKSMAAIKDAIAKAQMPLVAADKRRSEFIAQGRLAE